MCRLGLLSHTQDKGTYLAMSHANETAQGAQGVDNKVKDEKPSRDIKYTEKGLDYQIAQKCKTVRQFISQWHTEAEKLNVVLSDSSESSVITNARDHLLKVMNDLRIECSVLKSLLGESTEDVPILAKYDDIENEHHRLISSVADVLLDLKSDVEVFSKARSKVSVRSRYSSKRSVGSHHSEKQQLTAKKEALKIELKYMDRESKAKLEYDRIKAMKKLDITEATLEVHDRDEDDELNSRLDLPVASKDELVSKYVNSYDHKKTNQKRH